MKRFLLSFTFMLMSIMFGVHAHAQVLIGGTTGQTADASAMLDIRANNKGLLIPRMTTAQRTTIAAPAQGLMVYDTDLKDFYVYKNNAWTPMASVQLGNYVNGPITKIPAVGDNIPLTNLDTWIQRAFYTGAGPANPTAVFTTADGQSYGSAGATINLNWKVNKPTSGENIASINITTTTTGVNINNVGTSVSISPDNTAAGTTAGQTGTATITIPAGTTTNPIPIKITAVSDAGATYKGEATYNISYTPPGIPTVTGISRTTTPTAGAPNTHRGTGYATAIQVNFTATPPSGETLSEVWINYKFGTTGAATKVNLAAGTEFSTTITSAQNLTKTINIAAENMPVAEIFIEARAKTTLGGLTSALNANNQTSVAFRTPTAPSPSFTNTTPLTYVRSGADVTLNLDWQVLLPTTTHDIESISIDKDGTAAEQAGVTIGATQIPTTFPVTADVTGKTAAITIAAGSTGPKKIKITASHSVEGIPTPFSSTASYTITETPATPPTVLINSISSASGQGGNITVNWTARSSGNSGTIQSLTLKESKANTSLSITGANSTGGDNINTTFALPPGTTGTTDITLEATTQYAAPKTSTATRYTYTAPPQYILWGWHYVANTADYDGSNAGPGALPTPTPAMIGALASRVGVGTTETGSPALGTANMTALLSSGTQTRPAGTNGALFLIAVPTAPVALTGGSKVWNQTGSDRTGAYVITNGIIYNGITYKVLMNKTGQTGAFQFKISDTW